MTAFATAPHPIRTVLIANRGEIACRIMRTCRRLGLGTVAVHSDADAGALHVREADRAVRIGPAAAAASYLDIPAIIAAARSSGADAVHPGYGFLSENATFARACAEAGLVFIGPSAEAIAAMGSKIEAKKIADRAGVPTVPGYLGEDQSPARLEAEAGRIGYPVLIKASAGGGGRGMRRVDKPADFAAALRAAKAEAKTAFGDDTVLLERLIARPRHLEVQLVGDVHGNLVHLFERDCSVQRNNQKVFEEAPAPHLPAAVRDKLHESALRLGRAIGYTSAGTVEFIMEADGAEPWFLEMNTRLQVEHPVTEAITGIDLVEWQIRVAAGLPLPAMQDAIRARGHAIEARIAAERPDRGFLPATGTVSAIQIPTGVRFDTGVAEGSQVGLHYDSMIAKLIVHGPDRQAAVARLDEALGGLAVLGVGTNIGLLRDCVSRPAFASGHLTTGFLAEAFPGGWSPDPEAVRAVRAAAAVAWVAARDDDAAQNPWRRRSAFRVMNGRCPARCEIALVDDLGEARVTVSREPGGPVVTFADGARVVPAGCALIRIEGDRVQAALDGLAVDARLSLAIEASAVAAAEQAGDNHVVAPLPGIVTGLFVRAGARVEKGQGLIQMEAMKLVHTFAAPLAGRVARIHCGVGDTVAAGAPLIDIDPDEEA
jgi:acetyl/propionyl-CoA carboxylase alpha subunit